MLQGGAHGLGPATSGGRWQLASTREVAISQQWGGSVVRQHWGAIHCCKALACPRNTLLQNGMFLTELFCSIQSLLEHHHPRSVCPFNAQRSVELQWSFRWLNCITQAAASSRQCQQRTLVSPDTICPALRRLRPLTHPAKPAQSAHGSQLQSIAVDCSQLNDSERTLRNANATSAGGGPSPSAARPLINMLAAGVTRQGFVTSQQ